MGRGVALSRHVGERRGRARGLRRRWLRAVKSRGRLVWEGGFLSAGRLTSSFPVVLVVPCFHQ